MQNERLGKTIIDALTLCYVAEGKVLDHLREVKHQYSIDTFTLNRTSGKHHKEHFDIYLHKKKVATIYFDRFGSAGDESYVWLRIENHVLYNKQLLIQTLMLPELLDIYFNNITYIELARDFTYNITQKIRSLMRNPELKTIINGKQKKDREEAIDGIIRTCKISLNKDLPKSLCIKQAKAEKNKYDGITMDSYNKMDEITSKSHKQYILDYYGYPKKLHRLELRLNNPDIKKISKAIGLSVTDDTIFNQDALDQIYLQALQSLLRFTDRRKKLDWQMLFDCNLRYR